MTDDNRYDRGSRNVPPAGAPSSAAATPAGAPSPVVPAPGSLPQVDMDARAIHLCTLVVGWFAQGFLDHVFASTASPGSDKRRLNFAPPGAASLFYLPMRLGDIRGFATHLHLYAFPEDARLLPSLMSHLPHAHGVVVTLGAATTDTVDAVHAAGLPIPLALLGPAPARHGWAAGPPAFEGDATPHSVFPALKAISAGMLGALESR